MPTRHVVAKGECIASIALEHGFFPETIWEHSDNSELRQRRKDPYVLLEGDEIVIPDRQSKTVNCATGKAHVFRRKGVPEKLKMRLLRRGEPRGDLPYKLYVDGRLIAEAKTDGDGNLEHFVPPDSDEGELVLSERERYQLNLGHLDPSDTITGARMRLFNLGLLDDPDADDATYQSALKLFQLTNELDSSSGLDANTSDKLVEIHGR